MLSIKLPNKAKQVQPTHTVFITGKESGGVVLSLIQESKRRDNIIREKARLCPYKVGDNVIPKDAVLKEKYGTMYVAGICKSYAEYGKDTKWPEHDNPLIVTATSEDGLKSMFCSVELLEKV
jgi:hypothetical protein